VAGTVVAVLVLTSVFRHDQWVPALVVVAFLAVAFLKGTAPGGSQAWAEYQASKNSAG
jgi:hypothetical protein